MEHIYCQPENQMTFWDATNATIQIWVVRDISIEISALVSH